MISLDVFLNRRVTKVRTYFIISAIGSAVSSNYNKNMHTNAVNVQKMYSRCTVDVQ